MHSVCSVDGEWVGCGIEDREVNDGDNVKEVSRLRDPPMWQIMLPVLKGESPWKGEVDWDRVAYIS